MKYAIVGSLFAFSAMVASADVPRLADSVTVEQNSGGLVTVTYRLLDAEGIVTVDFQTNNVSIGAINFNNVYGDVNKLIEASDSKDRHIYWRPCLSWPEGGRIAEGFSAKVTVWPKTTPPDYMVIDLKGTSPQRYYTCADALPGSDNARNALGVLHPMYKKDKLVMRRVPAEGVTFTMGSPTTGDASYGRTGPRETPHKVTLTYDYYMAVFETTQGQWAYLAPDAADYGQSITGDEYPVARVKNSDLRGWEWPDDSATHDLGGNTTCLIAKMRAHFGIGFDLPTDAQWEYACRAGCADALYNGANFPEDWWESYEDPTVNVVIPALDEIAWYRANAGEGRPIHRVGQKKPNAWGFYDMLGNASEWVQDWCEDMEGWGDNGVETVSAADVVEPVGRATKASGQGRVLRGGCVQEPGHRSRVSSRHWCQEWDSVGDYSYGAVRLICPISLQW